MTKKFSIKKLVAGVLAAAMVVTALPVSGLAVKAAESTDGTLKVFRSYNPNSGEHLYTTNPAEQALVVGQGRTDEGAKFVVPEKSNTPVYRVYDANRGEHLLVPKDEAEGLAKIGWQNEGIHMYSDDNKGVPIYRVYNPDPNAGAGAHLYCMKDEAAYLVSIGWQWDNNGEPMIYGIDTEVRNDLALEKVESANGDNRTALKAYFKSPVGDLKPADIQIRRVDNNQLNTVESVAMSSDKMTATLYLTGFSAQQADALAANVDYKLIVTSGTETADKEFYIPAVATSDSVVVVNPTKKTVTLLDTTENANGARTNKNVVLNVPESLKIDYEEVLGRTVTAEYDKSNTITNWTVHNETVVYGAFGFVNTATTGDGHIVNLATGQSYYSQEFVTGKSDITPTYRVDRAADGTTAIAGSLTTPTLQDFDNAGTYVNNNGVAYAKVVLNSSGTVKTMVVEDTWGDQTSNVLVTKVNGTTVYGGTTEVDLKNYVIVKDGATIATTDIKAGDVVFYSTADKFAEVYTASKTGALEGVYNGRFAFGGKTYDESFATVPNLQSKARYVKSGGGLTDVDDDYMSALKESGKDITVYFNRAGNPVYVTGTTAEVKSTSVTVVLTAASEAYEQSLSDYIRIKGFNGTEIKTYDIDVSKLKTVTVADGTTYKVGYADQAKGAAAPAADSTFAGFIVRQATPGTAVHFGTEQGIAINRGGAERSTRILTAGTDLIEESLVTLTLNDKDEVVGINFEDLDGTSHLGKVMTGPGTNLVKGMTTIATTNGAGTAQTYQISGTTPVYVSDTTNHKVAKVDFKDYVGNAAVGNVHVYSSDDKNVSALQINKANLGLNGDGSTQVEGVIAGVEFTPGSTNNMSELTLIAKNGTSSDTATYTKKYTKFGADIAKAANIKTGAIVTATIASDGETVNAVAVNATEGTNVWTNKEINITSIEDQTFTVGTTMDALAFASTEKPTIVEYKDGVVSCIDFATFRTETELYKATFSKLGGSPNYVDTIVVTATVPRTNSVANYNAAKEAIDAITTTDLASVTLGVTADSLTTNASATTALQTKVNTAITGLNTTLAGATVTTTATVNDVAGNAANAEATDTVSYTVTVVLNGYSRTFTATTITIGA